MNKRGHIILGHPRSGTTLLRRLLNSHPEIASPPETHLFSACARFLQSDETAHGVDMGVLAGLHFSGFEAEDVLESLRGVAFTYLDRYAQERQKSLWVEKTAFDIFHLSEIEKLCQERVSYIGIIRHPLDVAVSMQEFCQNLGAYPADIHPYIQRFPQPIEAFVQSWIETTESLMDLGTRLQDSCIILRYEDLIEAPQETLEALFDHLGLECNLDQLIEKTFTNEEQLGFSDHKSYTVKEIHAKSLCKWRALPQQQIAKFASRLNPLLEACGYDRLEVEDYDLSVNRRMYLNSLMIHSK